MHGLLHLGLWFKRSELFFIMRMFLYIKINKNFGFWSKWRIHRKEKMREVKEEINQTDWHHAGTYG